MTARTDAEASYLLFILVFNSVEWLLIYNMNTVAWSVTIAFDSFALLLS